MQRFRLADGSALDLPDDVELLIQAWLRGPAMLPPGMKLEPLLSRADVQAMIDASIANLRDQAERGLK